jgi:hypothetical protein
MDASVIDIWGTEGNALAKLVIVGVKGGVDARAVCELPDKTIIEVTDARYD